jgi:hypothetical protein
MEKTHDYIYYYRGYWSDGGKCRIRIYREAGRRVGDTQVNILSGRLSETTSLPIGASRSHSGFRGSGPLSFIGPYRKMVSEELRVARYGRPGPRTSGAFVAFIAYVATLLAE